MKGKTTAKVSDTAKKTPPNRRKQDDQEYSDKETSDILSFDKESADEDLPEPPSVHCPDDMNDNTHVLVMGKLSLYYAGMIMKKRLLATNQWTSCLQWWIQPT